MIEIEEGEERAGGRVPYEASYQQCFYDALVLRNRPDSMQTREKSDLLE